VVPTHTYAGAVVLEICVSNWRSDLGRDVDLIQLFSVNPDE